MGAAGRRDPHRGDRDAVVAGVPGPEVVDHPGRRWVHRFVLPVDAGVAGRVPVGVAYGIWGASGTAATAVVASIIFGDPFTRRSSPESV